MQKQAQPTAKSDYAERLISLETVWWKKLLDVQAPYRWNLKRLRPGRVLEVGCGIGRNLFNLRGCSADVCAEAVGVDHNAASIAEARKRGLRAWTSHEFVTSPDAKLNHYDTLLLAHVVEHMTLNDAATLINDYRKYLKEDATILLITPQEAGFKSDKTHVEFMDFEKVGMLLHNIGASITRQYSFPFPRFVGKFFTYNEFVVQGRFSRATASK